MNLLTSGGKDVVYDRDTDRLIVSLSELDSEAVPLVSGPSEKVSLRTNKKTFLVTLCILITEMCERLTYYSVSAGLILFSTSHLDIGQSDATTINQVFSGFVYLIPIIGGFLADSYLGRYRTILIACCIYITGTILLPAAAIDYDSWGLTQINTKGRIALFATGLFLVAFGTGGIKANVGPFGAEQIETMGKDAVQSFFNWFYWVVNVGALIAYAGVAYIQQEISFAWGFFVPLASMVTALCIFVAVNPMYLRTQPKGSVLSTAWRICVEGSGKNDPERNSKAPKKKILSAAKRSHGGNFEDHVVDGVVSVIKVIPFCFLVIMYWAIYSQMSNTFFAQSERMDVRLGGGVNIPAAALNAFNTIAIILLIPVVDRVVYPCFEKIGKKLTYLKRIGIGMVLASIAMVNAGIVEIYRKEYMKEDNGTHVQELAGESFNASSMSVFLQIPQFTLIGASEIFTSVTTLEFAYNQAPVAMQGLVTGLFLAASGIGNWVSTAILAIVKAATEGDPWWGDEINETKMEYLMFLFAGLMMLNFFIFCVVSHYYTYQDPSTFEKAEVTVTYDVSKSDPSTPGYNSFGLKNPNDGPDSHQIGTNEKLPDGSTPF
ncbi:unnamed protein product [Lymnaea stagnalis]|uniref:Uncharacterized protein n=1 Tax=Lymnaea stagnalis TaxID=6523 RepID=A0AAV2HBN3_LYMST